MQWYDSVRDVLIRFGNGGSTADHHASVLLAAIEGALILARAQERTDPLDAVHDGQDWVREFERQPSRVPALLENSGLGPCR
jgi:hypothetical protein